MGKITQYTRKLLALIPLLIALPMVITWMGNREQPQKVEIAETVYPLRVIQVQEVALVPRIIGFGVAEPAETWRAMAEVKGRVSEIHPNLKGGAVVSEGEQLIKIESTEYENVKAKLEAVNDQIRAQLVELDVEEKNTLASIGIEERSLKLAEQSLTRKKDAFEKKAISGDEVDREERTVLTQRQNIQNLKNKLALIPSQRKLLQANLAASNADLYQARLDIEKTTIRAPFTCRLGEVSIRPGQYLNTGENLFEALGISKTEVVAKIRGDQLQNLFSLSSLREFKSDFIKEKMRIDLPIKVKVRYQSGDWVAEWDAKFSHIREAVDEQTSAINVVVAVDSPYEKIIPGVRPPLSRGMFCEVELSAEPRPGSIVIPRSALHNEDSVFLVDEQNRLKSRKVEIAFALSGFYCLKSGLKGGEILVVSDPTPAINGMVVRAIPDNVLQLRLVAEAQGKET